MSLKTRFSREESTKVSIRRKGPTLLWEIVYCFGSGIKNKIKSEFQFLMVMVSDKVLVIRSPRGEELSIHVPLIYVTRFRAKQTVRMWFIEPSELGSHAQMIHPLLVLLFTFPDPKSGEKRLL